MSGTETAQVGGVAMPGLNTGDSSKYPLADWSMYMWQDVHIVQTEDVHASGRFASV
jgi:hypothetical protein